MIMNKTSKGVEKPIDSYVRVTRLRMMKKREIHYLPVFTVIHVERRNIVTKMLTHDRESSWITTTYRIYRKETEQRRKVLQYLIVK